MARKTKVRTTIEPGVVITIDETELVDLNRQGLIYSSTREGFGSHEWIDDEPELDTDEAPAATDAKAAKAAKTEKGA